MNNRRWRGLVPAGILLVVLSGCGATAMIPSTGSATAETAAKGSGSQMETMDPEKLLQEDVWPVLSVLEGTAETAVWLPFEAKLEVENIDQNPELPNGCEITSAAIVLNYLGFEVDKVTLAEEYLPRCVPYWEADPRVEFMGNPEDELAFYCLPEAVVTAVNDYLEDVDAGYTAVDISGSAVEELYQWVAGGYPVMVWTTRAFSEPLYNDTFLLPDGGRPYSNSHCLVLTGYDDDTCYLADPMLEVETVERERFAESYLERGQYAVVIVPTELAE
ncbi:C39 family peptidase [uncultured Subdoligranulum sp.]|uniref:C39 family peptidase n=1 Tax=uncultured Subdoligranulum sp. TaxID=512298 RepID=UPI00320AFF6C